MDISNLNSQLAESQKVVSFSKDFFSLLGDLSSSFKDHLQQVSHKDSNLLQEQAHLKDVEQRREALSHLKKTNIEVKLANEKQALPEETLPLELQKPTLSQKKITIENNSEIIPSPLFESIKTKAKTQQTSDVSNRAKAPVLRKHPLHALTDTKQQPPEKTSLHSAIKLPKTQANPVSKENINIPTNETKKHPPLDTEQKIQAKESNEKKIPPIRINKQESTRLAKTLKDIATQTATLAPNIAALSQHVVSTLKASQSPLVKAIEPAPQMIEAPNASKNTAEKANKPTPLQSKPTAKEPPVEQLKKQVIKQVKFHLKMLLNEGKNQVQIQLKPHFLGNVKISIEMDGDQRIQQLNFHVQNESTKELIQSQLNQLRESLEEKDISLVKVDVQSEQDLSGQSSQSNQEKLENLQEAKKWIQSFQTLKVDALESIDSPISPEQSEDSDQIINIVV